MGNLGLLAQPVFSTTLGGGDPDFNDRGLAAMLKHTHGVCHIKAPVVTGDGKTYKVDLPKLFDIA